MVAGCATNPYTHRSQLMLVSLRKETDLGNRAYQAIVNNSSTYHPSADAATVDVVQRVADHIIAAAKRSRYAETAERFDWQMTVFDEPDIQNAFALPGGKSASSPASFRWRATKPAWRRFSDTKWSMRWHATPPSA
jgi:predicted Zn-dependent protease